MFRIKIPVGSVLFLVPVFDGNLEPDPQGIRNTDPDPDPGIQKTKNTSNDHVSETLPSFTLNVCISLPVFFENHIFPLPPRVVKCKILTLSVPGNLSSGLATYVRIS